jgi:hypothetical protein
MHDLEITGGGPKLREISTFCVNENPVINNPFCIQVWMKSKVCNFLWKYISVIVSDEQGCFCGVMSSVLQLLLIYLAFAMFTHYLKCKMLRISEVMLIL